MWAGFEYKARLDWIGSCLALGARAGAAHAAASPERLRVLLQQPKNQPDPRRTELRHGAFVVDAGVALGVVLGVVLLGVVLSVVLGVARSTCS
jgi:hypothetical protein